MLRCPGSRPWHAGLQSTLLGTQAYPPFRKYSKALRVPVAKRIYVGDHRDARETPDGQSISVGVNPELSNGRNSPPRRRASMPPGHGVARACAWAHELPNGTAGCTLLLLDSP